jgi:transcriptional regulator GlxA family with amidase domain
VIHYRPNQKIHPTSQLSDALGINRRTLERRFRSSRGHSILDEITLYRCSRAKRLLAHTELPIKQIAFFSGFSSENRLRTAFAKFEGKSPTDYREQFSRG